MKADEWLRGATGKLERAGVGTARLDCLVLLEDALDKDRAWLLAHPEFELTNKQLEKLEKQMEKRTQHVPLAQIRGKTEFYGREFVVNEHVLEPRPESETMIELLKQLVDSGQLAADSKIADVGCGSGALGITAKLEFPGMEVVLIDIDSQCLKVTTKNAAKYSARVKILRGDLLEPLFAVNCQLSAVLANLPYVPENYEINQAAMNEPRLAIFGGADGLDVYRRLFEQINNSENKPAYLCCESLPFQHETLESIAQKSGYKQLKEADFIQVFRSTNIF